MSITPLYTAVGSLFVARSFDKWNVPRKQGFGQGTHIRHMGAISALSAARTLLEDSLAGANASIRGTYLAKVPRALEVIGAAIGEQSLRVQPSTELRYLYNLCREFDPASSTPRSCPTIVQTSSTNGETARWNVSLRTRADDPFFSGTVSLVIVPFQGGIETAAALDPSYSSPRSTVENPVTRETLLLAKPPTVLVGRVDAPLVDTTPAGMSAKQREATIDLPVSTAIPSYHWLSHATFTVFLKRVDGGKTEYRLLAQRLGLKTSIQSRAIGSSTYALIGLPEDGQFIAYGGVLGDIATRAWATRAGDWSKPAYDGFGLPADWVPPFDPSLLGTGADDASATYLRHARAAADEATNAVKSAIDELLKEQSDEAAIKSAQRKAAGIAQLEQRALCGDRKPDCDTSPRDFNMFAEGYVTNPTCTGRLCLGALKLISAKVVPRTVRLAQAVYDRRNDEAAPAFNDYAGGSLQSALIAQWAALRKLKLLMIETGAGLVSHERQVELADAEYDHASGQAGYECSDELFSKAIEAGNSYDRLEAADSDTGSSDAWSPGPMIAQKQACERAQAAMPVAEARHAAVVAQAWAWMTSQMTVLLDAGSALQVASAEVAKALQATKLAKAQAELEASLAFDNVVTKFGTYRRYHSYDVWRARGLLESTRRYAAAARRAIEARYVVDLSEMRSDEPFVAAPATWADEVYEYDLAAPASVGLTAIPTGGGGGGGIYPNRLVDYVGNLERFVNGYAVARPTAIAQSDDEVFHVAGPDLRVGGVLSGDVAAWEFRCPDGSWVQHPGLDPETANAPIATVCGGPTPRRARVSFSLDPWGRLYGNIANPPYGRRHNARWRELAVNLVGTGLRDCAGAADPNSCYANAFVRYNLTHVGPAWVTDFDEQWRSLGVPAGSVEGAKGLAAEQWLDPTGNGFSKPYVANVARTEFAGRPIGGTYRLELEVTPDVRLDRLDRVQVLARSTYWVKQGKSDPPPAIATPPTLTSLDYDLADTAGGDSITITGTDLWNAIACTVGGTPATITSNTSTSLTFTMPPKSAGIHDVRVTTDEGAGNTLSIETWDPSLPTGCSVLLDGQVGRTDDGTGKLLSWAPRFGGNGNVTPYGGNPAKRPVNGVPLGFDGYDDSLYMAGAVLGGSTEQSTFFIARTTSTNTIARSGYSVPEPVISSSYLGSLGFSGPNVAIYPTAYMGVTTFSAAYPLNDGRPHLVGWAQEKPASDLITTVYADSQALGERVISSGVYYNSWGTLGEGYDSGGGPSVTDYFHGDLYAVISYARKLTTEERTKLYKWSRARYHVD